MKLGNFVIEYLGLDAPDYFPGYGVAFTPYKHCTYGIGSTIQEALDDCIDMFAQSTDIDVTPEVEKRLLAEFGDYNECNEDLGALLYHVGIKWNEIP